MKKKAITICSSAAFFAQALDAEKQLKKMGFAVKLPYTALKMKKSGDFRVETYKTWFKDPKSYSRKSWLMKNHFRKVMKSDAVLVINHEKNGVPGYIGGNTLIEMTIAFHYKKPIYVLNPISDDLGFKEEIFGLQPIFLNGDLGKIKR
ncbi:MAG: hypothetical protein ABSC29_02205 [Minisyncoccia bacterium]|jgi:hypothetical protein